MKITLANYQTAAADFDVSALTPEDQSMHALLLQYGPAVVDGADEATQAEVDDLIRKLNGAGGAAPAAKKSGPKAPAPEKPAAKKTPAAPKKAAVPKKAAAPKPAPAGGNVRGISVAVGLVRGFVQLLGKPVLPARVEAKLRGVQRALLDGHVTKNTPHARVVDEVQDLLLKACNNRSVQQNPEQALVLQVQDDAVKARLVGIAGGETVFESVAVLKAFVRLSGKVASAAQLASLLKRTASPKIKDGDPFQEELKAVHEALKRAKPDAVLAPAPVGLSGVAQGRLAGLPALVKRVDAHTVRLRTTAKKKPRPLASPRPATAKPRQSPRLKR